MADAGARRGAGGRGGWRTRGRIAIRPCEGQARGLARAAVGRIVMRRYGGMWMQRELVTRHDTSGGAQIYRLPLRVFPQMYGYAYVVVADDYAALIDTGSGLGDSDADLLAGFAALPDLGARLAWPDLRRIVVTHAHIDHYGGLGAVRAQSAAPIAMHALDHRVITHHDERLALGARAIGDFLRYAGVDQAERARLLRLHRGEKPQFISQPVAGLVEDGDLLDGVFRIFHAPGHAPGQICLQVDDVLLTADHILPRASLFLSPERVMPATGLEHFLLSLTRVGNLPGVRLGLGGHDAPMDDLAGTARRLADAQQRRLDQVRELCRTPHTIAGLMQRLYANFGAYDELLAIQKAGVYIEHLDRRGELAVVNSADVAQHDAAPVFVMAGG